jgi:hypothetical protein
MYRKIQLLFFDPQRLQQRVYAVHKHLIDNKPECALPGVLANQHNRMVEIRVIQARHSYEKIA